MLLSWLLLACDPDQGVSTHNTPPDTPVITSHADGESLRPGTVELWGTVNDIDDPEDSLNITWALDSAAVCPDATPDPTGVTVCVVDLNEPGEVKVALTVRDPQNGTASTSILLQVTPSDAPEPLILTPEDGAVLALGDVLELAGSVSDPDDEATELSVSWALEPADGGEPIAIEDVTVLSNGDLETELLTLSEAGTFAVRLRATDPSGETGADSVTVEVLGENQDPTCSIDSPEEASAVALGEPMTFEGTVLDPDGAPEEASVTWTSDLDGTLKAGSPDSAGATSALASDLSAGWHLVTLDATDARGGTCTAERNLLVNEDPVLVITQPVSGDTVDEQADTTLSVTVSDTETAATDLALTWDLDGDTTVITEQPLSDGTATFTTSTLAVGTHTLTVTAEDPHGGTAFDAVTFTVNGLANAPTLSISPGDPLTADDLTAVLETPSTDPEDGDLVDLASDYDLVWTRDGTTASTGSVTASATGTSKSETWQVQATPRDSHGALGTPATASVTIGNTPPEATAVSVTPATATVEDTLVCTASTSDVDGDSVTLGYAWSLNGTPTGDTSVSFDPSSLTQGDEVICTVTPTDSDGLAGTAVDSNTVTIDGASPRLSQVDIDPAGAQAGDTLTCVWEPYFTDPDGDGDASTLVWTVNGSAVGTDTTLSGAYVSGDSVICTVTPTDDTGDTGIPVDSPTLVVDNTAPSIGSVSITPDPAAVGDTLTCAWSGWSDADGDTDASIAAWSIGGTSVGTGTTLASGFSGGDTVTCEVTPHDGTDAGTPVSTSLVVDNTPPVLADATLAPDPAVEADTLTCTPGATTDADGTSVFSHATAWTVSGSGIAATGETLDGTWFDRSDTVACTVTPSDGTDDGASVTSNTITVDNTAPTVSDVAISPDPATTDDALTCSWTFDDDDGDSDASSVVWTSGSSLLGTGATLAAGSASEGDTLTCTVTPSDGTDSGAAASASLTLGNSAPTIGSVSLSGDAVEAGTLTCAVDSASDPDGDSISYIYAWSVSGSDPGVSTETLTGTDFDKGDTVSCTVTPSDGSDSGDPVSSTELTIANTAPAASDLAVDPAAPTLSDDLTCTWTFDDDDGDSDVSTVSWTIAGTEVGTDPTLAAGSAVSGDTLTCTVTPHDGEDAGTADSVSVSFSNSPPVVSGVTLSGDAVEDGTLSCDVDGVTDDDGDSVTYSYAWDVSGSDPGVTDPTLDGTWFDRDDTVACTVTPHDGTDAGAAVSSDTVTIANTPPVLADVTLTGDNVEGGTLTCVPGTATDADGDSVSYSYAWDVSGSDPGVTDAELTSDHFENGHDVTCTVTPSDGTDSGDPVTSAEVIIENTPPVLADVSITGDAIEGGTLTCEPGTASDADGDSISYDWAWSVNGSDLGLNSQTLSSDDFDRDDVVTCSATPVDWSGSGDSVTSSEVTIANSVPVVSDVTIDPQPATTSDTLTCAWTFDDADGDSDNSSVAWASGSSTLGTSATLSGSLLADGDTVTCTVTPSDGTDTGTAGSASAKVGNAAPSISSVSISPATAYVGDTLTCAYSGYSDLEGDTDASTYSWTIADGSVVGTSADLVVTAAHGDALTCTVTPYDGNSTGTPLSETRTISNTAPIVTSAVISGDAVEDGTLTCTGTASDADSDTLTYSYAWSVGGIDAGVTSDTLTGTDFDKGDEVTCSVTANDGEDDSNTESSPAVTIDNTAPGAATVSMSPAEPVAGTDDLVCTIDLEAADSDGDSVTYEIAWEVDGLAYTDATTTTWTGDTVPAADVMADETWTCTVTSFDGEDYGGEASGSATASCEVFTWYLDFDGDGYGDASSSTEDCSDAGPSGYVSDDTDCDDTTTAVNPGESEVCDGQDNNCDILTDADDPTLVSVTVSVPGDYAFIQDAIDAACDGDTVSVDAGTYTENIDFAGLDINVSGAGSETSIIDGSASGSVVTMDIGTLSGFTLQNGAASYGAGLYVGGLGSVMLEDLAVTDNSATYGAIYASPSGDLTVSDSTVADNTADYGGAFVLMMSGTSDITLSSVEMTGNTTDVAHGVIWANQDSSGTLTLEDMLVWGNSSEQGIHVDARDGLTTLTNIVLFDNSGTCANLYDRDGDIEVTNVTCVSNNGDGIEFDDQGSGSLTAVNVLSTHNGGYGIVGNNTPVVSLTYNDVYGNASGEYSGLSDPTGSDGNLSVDPDFVFFDASAAATTWDLHLDPASPLIDAGDPSITDDDGTTSDIGAYGGAAGDASYSHDDDNDGMADGWEDANGLDSTTDDSGDDPDLDGATNLEEYTAGSDPQTADQVETCDGLDNDGDSSVDEGLSTSTWYEDADGDGYGDASTSTSDCAQPSGTVSDDTDCDDAAAAINPGAEEICFDAVDDDCDGQTACLSSLSDAIALQGIATDDRAGSAVSAAGDVNGDGYDDLLIGAFYADDGGSESGAAYLVHGPVTGTDSLSNAEATFIGEESGDTAGHSVAGGGDLDGDGLDDLVIGAIGWDVYGVAYVVSGNASGTVDLSGATATLRGGANGDWAGASVAIIDDANGDGLHDLLVGAYGVDTSASLVGAAYLFHGPVSGDITLTLGYDAELQGYSPSGGAGSAVAGGDIDGDGVAEVLVGAPWMSTDASTLYQGEAYLLNGPVSGSSSLSSADALLTGEAADDNAGHSLAIGPDLDGDGYGDLLVGAYGESTTANGAGAVYVIHGPVSGSMDLGSADAKLLGEGTWDHAGAALDACDVDGDAVADAVVGAFNDSTEATYAGAAYIVLGPLSGAIDLAEAEAKHTGTGANAYAGYAVACAGDTDGDALEDLLIGSYGDDTAASGAGAAYLVLGSSL